MWVILIVVMLIIAVVGIYVWWHDGKTNSNTNILINTTDTTDATVNDITGSNPNDNSETNLNTNTGNPNWARYKNDEIGISFNYPIGWDDSYYTSSERTQYYKDSIFAVRKSYHAGSPKPGYGEIIVRQVSNSDNLSLSDWVRTNDPVTDAETLKSEDSSTVDEQNAILRRATSKVAGGVLELRYVLHKGNMIIIETNSRISSDDQAIQSQFDADATIFLESIILF